MRNGCTGSAYLLLVLILAALFGPALVGEERLAFRDTSHFYTPLYEYVAHRQYEQWLPLWNPLDLTGLPLVGETTTAVFYPPRIVVYKLFDRPDVAITWYLLLHLILAGVAIHIAARMAGAKPLGCALAILVYPLCGPVFFLTYNVPFLVGAAWLPLAVAGGMRLRSRPTRRWISVTALALAMPILAGDPQTTIHVLLIGSVAIFTTICRSRFTRQSALALVAAFGLAIALAAPQWAASIDWGGQSSRVLTDHSTDRLDFSVPLWHWIELLLPAASGRLYPIYSRISHGIPGDGRTWALTLYAGLLPLVLALDRWQCRWRRLDVWDNLLPLGLALSLGAVYSVLANLTPGYGAFRYPGKWLPVAMLGLSISAARHVRLISCRSIFLRRKLVVLATIGLVAGVCIAISTSSDHWIASSRWPADRFWGPLRLDLATKLVTASTARVVLLAAILWWLVRDQPRLRQAWWKYSLLVLVSLDLFVVTRGQMAKIRVADENRWLIPVPEPTDNRGLRTAVTQWPDAWRETSSEDRLLEVEVSQRNARFGRWHLVDRQAMFNSMTSLRSQRIDALWSALARQNVFQKSTQLVDSRERVNAWLGIDHQWICVPETVARSESEPLVVLTAGPVPGQFETSLIKWHSVWRATPPQRRISVDSMSARVGEVASSDDSPGPLLETNRLAGSTPDQPAKIQWLAKSDDDATLNIGTNSAGLLEIKQFQDGNWHAAIEPIDEHGAPIGEAITVIVNRLDYLFMGIEIPAGDWRLCVWYRPWWLVPSGATWAMAMVAITWLIAPPRKKS